MEFLRQASAIVRWNFLGFHKNPRIILTFLFSFILCFFLSDRALLVADYYGSSMQALEPFIWTFGDATSILLSSLLLILLFGGVFDTFVVLELPLSLSPALLPWFLAPSTTITLR